MTEVQVQPPQLQIEPSNTQVVPANGAEPEPTQPIRAAHMTGLRKVAVLLITVGEQAGGDIIKDLNEEELQLISRIVSTADPVTSEEAFMVLREFHELATARSYVVKGGVDYASRMLRHAFGVEGARRLLDRVTQAISNEAANFDSLQRAEPQQLANFIQSEHPQTVALILSHLNPTQSAALLSALPEEAQCDLAKRMASLEQISPEIINRIAHVIGDRLKSLGDISRQSYGGVRAVAEMLNRMDANLRKRLLTQIAEDDSELVTTIRHLMFVFEDLLTIDAVGIRELINAADRQVLTVALKGTSEKLQIHIMQNLSVVGAEMLREDMDAMGPVKIRDVEAAQQQIIALVRELEAKGVLTLSSASNESYVV